MTKFRGSLATILLLGLIATAGCAPAAVAPGSTQLDETLVETEPEDTRCRAEGRIGRQDARAAPLMVEPRRLGYPVTLRCAAIDHFDAAVTIHAPLGTRGAALPDAVLTRRLADGAGITVDAVPHDPPNRLTVRLLRRRFDSAADREAFYGAVKTSRGAFWADLRHRVLNACESGQVPQTGGGPVTLPTVCRQALANLGQQRDADLRGIEISRRRASFR